MIHPLVAILTSNQQIALHGCNLAESDFQIAARQFRMNSEYWNCVDFQNPFKNLKDLLYTQRKREEGRFLVFDHAEHMTAEALILLANLFFRSVPGFTLMEEDRIIIQFSEQYSTPDAFNARILQIDMVTYQAISENLIDN